MPAFLLPILAKILPYLAGLVSIVVGYFYIKRKGAVEEREKLKSAQQEILIKRTEDVQRAIEKDKKINESVGEKVEKAKPKPVEKPAEGYNPGDIFKF